MDVRELFFGEAEGEHMLQTSQGSSNHDSSTGSDQPPSVWETLNLQQETPPWKSLPTLMTHSFVCNSHLTLVTVSDLADARPNSKIFSLAFLLLITCARNNLLTLDIYSLLSDSFRSMQPSEVLVSSGQTWCLAALPDVEKSSYTSAATSLLFLATSWPDFIKHFTSHKPSGAGGECTKELQKIAL